MLKLLAKMELKFKVKKMVQAVKAEASEVKKASEVVRGLGEARIKKGGKVAVAPR